MNMNPYAPPQAHDDAQGAGVGQRIDPAEAERIRREIQRLNRTSLLLGG